jgi:predicted Zn finger-like uncharacterized protein
MALATRCPNCRTLFRISAEQLRAHNGMVRCGACRQVFNAMAHLDYLDPSSAPGGATEGKPGGVGVTAGAVAEKAARAAVAGGAVASRGGALVAAGAAAGSAVAAGGASGGHSGAASVRTAGRAPVEAERSIAVAPVRPRPAPIPDPEGERDEEPLEKSVNTIFAVPPGEEEEFPDEAAGDEPVFLRQVPAERLRRRAAAGWAAGSLLAIALLVQALLLYRAEIAAQLPDLQPTLAAMCEPFGCTATWPMRPEFLAVVSSELQAIPGTGTLELTAVIRNRADYPMALPALELTLTDTFERTIGRRVFMPGEYAVVSATDSRSDALGAGADLTLRLLFQPPAPSVAGFVAYPFYP